MLKTLGYLVSSVSVLLLGWVTWDSTSDEPTLRFALLAGMAASILGMLLRWTSFLREHREKPKGSFERA